MVESAVSLVSPYSNGLGVPLALLGRLSSAHENLKLREMSLIGALGFPIVLP